MCKIIIIFPTNEKGPANYTNYSGQFASSASRDRISDRLLINCRRMHADNTTEIRCRSVCLYALYTYAHAGHQLSIVQTLVKQRHVIDRPSCLIQFQSGLRSRTTIRSFILRTFGHKTD